MTRKRSKVLLVDDDTATRLGLAEFFTEAGYEVQAVGSFEEGMRALRSGSPDFLIADVRLGAFNGLQLLVSSPRSIPAIIITGFADPVLESDARQHGAEYVLKPVSPHVLLEMVGRRLARVEESQFETVRRWDRKPVPGGSRRASTTGRAGSSTSVTADCASKSRGRTRTCPLPSA